jgi:hypothetical protein
VVLCGCETWSLTVREAHSLRVFENRVLRRIFGPRTDKVTGEWRKLHDKELRDLYSSPSIIRSNDRLMGFCTRINLESRIFTSAYRPDRI